jgi:hypothetical protein
MMNQKRIETSASMDPLPYELTFPQGGHIWIKTRQVSGTRQVNVYVGGASVAVRPNAVGPKNAR